MQEIQTFSQYVSNPKQREMSDKALNAFLAQGWNVQEISTQPARINSDGLRIIERIVTLIREIEETDDEPLIFMPVGYEPIFENGKLVGSQPYNFGGE